MKYDLEKIRSKDEDLWKDPLKTKIFSLLPVNSIIIDAGSRDGDWIHAADVLLYNIFNWDKENHIKSPFIYVGIDPILCPNIKRYDFFIQGAISNENKKQVPFFIVESEPGCNSLKSPSNSLQESIYRGKKREISGIEKIKTFRLDKIISRLTNDTKGTPGYLKLDVQGSELECIEGAGDFLQQFMFIETEIGLDKQKNFYKKGSELEELIQLLDDKNFEPILFSRYSTSPLPEGEIIFKNKKINI